MKAGKWFTTGVVLLPGGVRGRCLKKKKKRYVESAECRILCFTPKRNETE